MKNLKKITSVAVMLVMMLALAVPALAADVTINIDTSNGEDKGETYTVYKIFDATVKGETSKTEGEGEDKTVISEFANISYTIDESSPFFATVCDFKVKVSETEEVNAFTLTKINNTTEYVVTLAHDYSAADLAKALLAVSGKTPVSAELTNAKAPLTVPDKGYYLITSSLGSMAVVDTIGANNMTIKTKNDLPTLTKKITNVSDNGSANDGVHATAAYGSVVTYTITVDIPASANGPITVHDKMDSRLTFVGLTDESWNENVKRENLDDDCTWELVISETEVKMMVANSVSSISFEYTAIVNGDAPIGVALKNSAHLTYSNYTSTPSEVDVTTYSFDLVKTNSNNFLLNGAEFKLFKNADKTDSVLFTANADKTVYTVVPAGTTGAVDTIVVTNGKVTINGLSGENYYLQETKAPEGYNAIDDAQTVKLATFNGETKVLNKTENTTAVTGEPTTEAPLGTWTSGGYKIVNLTGAELPSTGGIGTTIFYVVGGLLVIGAGVMLVTKKRVSDQEQ